MRMTRSGSIILTLAAVLALAVVLRVGAQSLDRGAIDGWPVYGHDPGGMRYSPLTQISRQNVSRLKIAWVSHTGDLSDGREGSGRSAFEATPLVTDGTMYVTTGFNRVIALDPETGAKRWSYDPHVDLHGDYGDGLINRGVATWVDASAPAGRPCRRRVFEVTLDARLIALDARTGAPCADFGEASEPGQISLRRVTAYEPGRYHMTSPPTVVDDRVIVGSAINDNNRAHMASGVVRAFDARTGALRWAWDPMPAALTAESGAANAWSIMAADAERHLVFVPTGSASPDYYGGQRPGDDRWANSVVALRAASGEFVWGFQLVHHDLWDYDTAAPPLLATVTRGGRSIPVVVQGNKTGFLYVLDRETGRPIFPVEERPVPRSDVAGEAASPTQPVPTAPPAITPQRLAADAAWGATPADRQSCRAQLAELRNDGLFTPPSLQGTLVLPGMFGGMNWSGSAFDPTRALLVANSTVVAAKMRLIPREAFNNRGGRNEDGDYAAQAGTPYGLFRRFIQAPSGLPCTPPPWGLLTAVDLSTGALRWQVPLGSLSGFGGASSASIPPASGSFSLGGPIITAGGLVFIAGTFDPFLRALDVETGRELWKGDLPVSGHATPMTYRLRPDGPQFVVIAAGGHAKIAEERVGDALVAFTLDGKR